ncbi:hypothetical protein C8J56DRAFT_797370 [Mycena floridula]|nr:hypothetical protein C8J56DRAFT_797370 [Mycena floridula]
MSEAQFPSIPFPPPSLVGVPMEYIIDQLHNLAPHYWDKPDTADCTIIIPVPYPRGLSFPPSSPLPTYDPSGLGRRLTEPTLNFVPRIVLKLHTDYLSAHSNYLRALFSSASPCDLINSSSSPTSIRHPGATFTIPANRLPRLMPASTPTHPVLFLPVPDPSSIHLLFHWMYFGETDYIIEYLDSGVIQWEGIARNVEYLGLPADIKVFLGRWYGSWLQHEPSGETEDDGMSSDEEDTDSINDNDSDYDFHEDQSSSTSVVDMDVDEDEIRRKHIEEEEEEEEQSSRGRNRTVRCLSWTGPDKLHQERDERRSTWSGPAVVYEMDDDENVAAMSIPS